MHVDARGRSSGVELTQRFALHVRFKDGKLWGVSATDVDEARCAVGLALGASAPVLSRTTTQHDHALGLV